MPSDGSTTIDDAVQGAVTIQNKVLDDMVILRGDGSPTYMLAVVVDDHDILFEEQKRQKKKVPVSELSRNNPSRDV